MKNFKKKKNLATFSIYSNNTFLLFKISGRIQHQTLHLKSRIMFNFWSLTVATISKKKKKKDVGEMKNLSYPFTNL